jgi:hypothetical protein
VAIGVYAAVVVGIAAIAVMALRSSALDIMRPAFPPEVLAQKARDAIRQLGYSEPARDDAYGYQWDDGFIDYVRRNDGAAPDWKRLLTGAPSPLGFWYRRSQAPMTGLMFHSDLLTPGIVDLEDPPPIESGMIQLRLDHRGRLLFFEAIPPQVEEQAPPPAPVDWAPLFSLAELDMSALATAPPRWHWLAASDTRAAWTGTWPGSDRPLRVEAAALGGRPVAFMLIGPWHQPWRTPASADGDILPWLVLGCVALVILVGAVVLARKHLREGRGDRRSAMNLGYFTVFQMLALWAFDVHAVAALGLIATFLVAICTSVFNGVLLWTIYIALEPVVRRRWPQALVSWTTLFSGRSRDAVVGRDVLVGVAMGVAWVLIIRGVDVATGGQDVMSSLGSVAVLGGLRSTLGAMTGVIARAIRTGLFFFLLLFVWRVLLRRQWAAAMAFAATFALLDLLGGRPWISVVTNYGVLLMAALVVVRGGLVSLTVGLLVTNVLLSTPLSSDLSAWYFGNAVLFVGLTVALATWAFYISVGNRVWKEDLLR